MGGSVSAGRTNDELVDNLVDGGLIKSHQVERVFRAVDRGIFYLPDHRESAYRDLAWREGLIHISAPCIYAQVMENLELRTSQYFLNIGSGSGYFSTMAGLILGANGINHNIELHQEMVDYSKQKVTEFIQKATYFDDFDFCKPKFVNGNVFNLVHPSPMLYDRIYVGAGASTEHEDIVKHLLRVNGICIIPLNDGLVKIKRLEENTWEKNTIMAVSYASLVTENVDLNVRINLPNLQPHSLQELCRFKIRKLIRESIESQDENYFKIKREMSTFNPDRSKQSELKSSDDSGSEDTDQNVDMFNNFERIFSTRLRSGDHNIDNQLRRMIYGHLMDANNRLSVDEDEDDSDDGQSRALVLVRREEENEEIGEGEPTPRQTGDSGVSEESQSSSLSETSRDQQKLKKVRKNYVDERRENLLRSRIMQLPIPVNVKKFVLYYRDI